MTSGCCAWVSRIASCSGRPSTPPRALISATASCWPRIIIWPSPAYRPVTGLPEPITIGCLLPVALPLAADDGAEARPPANPPPAPTTRPPAPAAPRPRRKFFLLTPVLLAATWCLLRDTRRLGRRPQRLLDR